MSDNKSDIENTETVNLGSQTGQSPQIETAETDPLMIRDTDTTKLKRVSPSTQNINLDGENYTDTVHLKVIKERKKQLSGILTASQTIRLRPPSAGTKSPEVRNTDSTVMTQELKLPPQKDAASTLKVADPASTDTGTIKVSGPASAGTLRVKAPVAAEPSSAGTLKIQAPVTEQANTGGTLKVKSPDDGGGTLKIKTPDGGGTLKIKASGPTQGASGTLKIKAPVAADETLKVDPNAGGGTLKLKTAGTQTATAPQAKTQKRAQSASSDEALLEEDTKGKPGIVTILVGLAASGVLGFTVFKNIDQYMEMFKIAGS
ncbi:hypothetical protein LNTAR_24708 [Lentisphaera araneosa HTCC2155]|uniref:Uncharacterized protein n=1 Tax=Lentisphaera araneosa HTCC2155 TaxID=313628 RepID=A6DSU9_9BACT|nr:hypothetical protein [Lentisphaera araneosa]EDM25239.1 hypothetical protein LNTAR_24708 [Lentisphaera araneosa HTCC2155]